MKAQGAGPKEIELTKQRGRGEGRWARDPYGRGRVLKWSALQFAFVYGVALLAGGPRSAAQRLGIVTLPCLWLAGLYTVWFWSPAPRAIRNGSTLVVRVTPWKRLALPAVLPLPVGLWVITHFKEAHSGWVVAGLISLMVALYWSTKDRFHVTDWGVERAVAALGPKQKIAWSEITRIGLWPAGITLGAPGKPTVSLYGVMLDGYPELVREVLKRIPEAVDATPEARERLERVAALVDEGGRDED